MSHPPRGHSWQLAALSLAMLLPSLGISVANVGLPSLRAAFSVSSQEAQWVVIAYLVVVTSFLVTAGRLGDLLGRKRLLLAGITLFSTASMAAVFAPTIWVVIAARAVQGIGAAMIMSLTVAAVGDAVPEGRSGMAIGLLGTVSAIGTAAGPSLGGMLVGAFGWPSIFALMAGVGLLTVPFVAAQLPNDRPSDRRPTFDVPGALLLMLTVASFALSTTLTPLSYLNGALAALATLGVVVFARVERSAPAPLVQLAMLKRPAIGAGLFSIGLVSAIVMTTLVVGPFYLTGVLALDAAAVGLAMSVGPTVSALVGIPAGRLVDRHGPPVAIYLGLSLLLAGTVAMTFLPATFGVSGYVGSLVMITAGYALFQAANNTALMATARKDQRGVTSALLALGRNLGLIIGASAMGALFAIGSDGAEIASESGFRITFAASSAFVVLAMGLSAWATRATQVASK